MKNTLINVGHVNICSLPNKTDHVRDLLEEHSLHILGITESRLSAINHGDAAVRIPHYVFYRRDAVVAGHTGIGAYVKRSLSNRIKRRTDLEPDNIECLWLEIRPCDKLSFLVGFIYRNPKSNVNEWSDDYVQMMTNVTSGKRTVIIQGDFNVDLLVDQPEWEATTSMLGLTQLINEPTRVDRRKTRITSTLLDHIYTNDTAVITEYFASDICLSDHKPVICTWSAKRPKPEPKGHTYVRYRCFKHFDKDVFCDDLADTDFDVLTLDSVDVNKAASAWSTTFLSIVDKHIPMRVKRVRHSAVPGWMNSDIKQAMRVRDKMKKDQLFDEYKKQRNKVTELIRKAKKAYFEKLVTNNKSTSQVWRAMNELSNKTRRNNSTPMHNFSPDDFNNHFTSATDKVLGSPSPPSFNTPESNHMASTNLSTFCRKRLKITDSFKIPYLSVRDVIRLIAGLSNKKTMDSFNLNAHILKLALPCIAISLTHLYNRCIEEHVFPDIFKEATVIPLPKSKDTSTLDNFRPISILPILSKPLEKHIHGHLSKHMEDKKLFHPFQSGFRSLHSCHTALVRLYDSWLKAIYKHEIVGAVFLDLRKAFDLVDHDLLGHKLLPYIQDSDTVSFFQSYLSNRSQKTLVQGASSAPGFVTSGVPQGSILGPLLFGIHINDLPLNLRHKAVELDLFADDSSLSARGKDTTEIQSLLQDSVNDVVQWCYINKMALNPSKSKSMVITTRQKHQLQPLKLAVNIDTNLIEQVNVHCVLGVIIDDQLSWKYHIKEVCTKVARNIHLLRKLWHFVPTDALKTFFYAHCVSHINYASTVWCNADEVHVIKLNSLHKRAVKIMHRDPSGTMSTNAKYTHMKIITLPDQFKYNASLLMSKQLLELAPSYIQEMFPTLPNKRTRDYKKPTEATLNKIQTGFAFWGASVWKELPLHCKMRRTLSSFKCVVRKHLLMNPSPV